MSILSSLVADQHVYINRKKFTDFRALGRLVQIRTGVKTNLNNTDTTKISFHNTYTATGGDVHNTSFTGGGGAYTGAAAQSGNAANEPVKPGDSFFVAGEGASKRVINTGRSLTECKAACEEGLAENNSEYGGVWGQYYDAKAAAGRQANAAKGAAVGAANSAASSAKNTVVDKYTEMMYGKKALPAQNTGPGATDPNAAPAGGAQMDAAAEKKKCLAHCEKVFSSGSWMCFDKETEVIVRNYESTPSSTTTITKSVGELQIGDEVLTQTVMDMDMVASVDLYGGWKSGYTVEFEPVLCFLHRNEEQWAEFLEIRFGDIEEDASSLTKFNKPEYVYGSAYEFLDCQIQEEMQEDEKKTSRRLGKNMKTLNPSNATNSTNAKKVNPKVSKKGISVRKKLISTTSMQGLIHVSACHLLYSPSRGKFVCARALGLKDTVRMGKAGLLLIRSGNHQKSVPFIDLPIRSIKKVQRRGFYAPLTPSGTLFANGILASCYALPKDIQKDYRFFFNLMEQQTVLHLGCMPLRVAKNVENTIRYYIMFGDQKGDEKQASIWKGISMFGEENEDTIQGSISMKSDTIHPYALAFSNPDWHQIWFSCLALIQSGALIQAILTK